MKPKVRVKNVGRRIFVYVPGLPIAKTPSGIGDSLEEAYRHMIEPKNAASVWLDTVSNWIAVEAKRSMLTDAGLI